MPRPPLLPKIDWKSVFDNAHDFKSWLSTAEFPEAAKQMQSDFESFALTKEVAHWLENIPGKVHVVCIAEDWCGDVTRHVPVLERLAAASSGKINTKYLSREENLDLFARYLTNGGEALPKFVFLSANWIECGNWGPMPLECKELIARGKACNDVSSARVKVSELYRSDSAKDRVVEELLELIDIASTVSIKH
jgi:hypothetical protein